MKEWWDSLELMAQIFYTIAISATIILIIQSVLLLFGIGFDSDADYDLSGEMDAGEMDGATDGLSLFTIRGLVAFFAVGGWTGLAVFNGSKSTTLAIIISFLAGTVALVTIAFIFKYALKLQGSGNITISNSIGKNGEVYIPIPANRKGSGKIMINLQERLCELTAVTLENHELKTGEYVKVTEVIDEQTVLVVSCESDKTIENKGGISKWIQ